MGKKQKVNKTQNKTKPKQNKQTNKPKTKKQIRVVDRIETYFCIALGAERFCLTFGLERLKKVSFLHWVFKGLQGYIINRTRKEGEI